MFFSAPDKIDYDGPEMMVLVLCGVMEWGYGSG